MWSETETCSWEWVDGAPQGKEVGDGDLADALVRAKGTQMARGALG